MKTKIKSCGDEVADFYDNKISKTDPSRTCLAVISLGFPLKKDANYYLQVFLKECVYIGTKVMRHINVDMSDSSYSDESNEVLLCFLGFYLVKRVHSEKWITRYT